MREMGEMEGQRRDVTGLGSDEKGIRIAIDRGGTFTDCVGNPGSGRMEDDVVCLSNFLCILKLSSFC